MFLNETFKNNGMTLDARYKALMMLNNYLFTQDHNIGLTLPFVFRARYASFVFTPSLSLLIITVCFIPVSVRLESKTSFLQCWQAWLQF